MSVVGKCSLRLCPIIEVGFWMWSTDMFWDVTCDSVLVCALACFDGWNEHSYCLLFYYLTWLTGFSAGFCLCFACLHDVRGLIFLSSFWSAIILFFFSQILKSQVDEGGPRSYPQLEVECWRARLAAVFWDITCNSVPACFFGCFDGITWLDWQVFPLLPQTSFGSNGILRILINVQASEPVSVPFEFVARVPVFHKNRCTGCLKLFLLFVHLLLFETQHHVSQEIICCCEVVDLVPSCSFIL